MSETDYAGVIEELQQQNVEQGTSMITMAITAGASAFVNASRHLERESGVASNIKVCACVCVCERVSARACVYAYVCVTVHLHVCVCVCV